MALLTHGMVLVIFGVAIDTSELDALFLVEVAHFDECPCETLVVYGLGESWL